MFIHTWSCFRPLLITRAVCILILALPFAASADETVRDQLRKILDGPAQEFPSAAVRAEWTTLSEFYAARDHEPVWVNADGPLARAETFVDVLSQSRIDGLDPANYGAETLVALMNGRMPVEAATLELLFSGELLHYAGDLQRGRTTPARVSPQLHITPDKFDRTTVLAGAARAPDIAAFLAQLAPDNTPYRQLRTALADYRAIAAKGEWPVLPDGRLLKAGTRDPRVAVLRQRLIAGGDLESEPDIATSGDPELFDDELERAVIRFQQRFGLATDGVVGPLTRAQLNVPVDRRIRQIEINMERWRWMPEDPGKRHVRVNIAGFELDLIERDETVLNLRAIVGLPYRRTPVFSNRITYLELNPYWTVPPGILRNDLLPKIRKDPGYLVEQDIRVYAGWSDEAPRIDPWAIDWATVDPRHIPYRFVQSPGPLNPLGRVKFMFPNRFNVYLHDTPAKDLFERPVRAFSSGCIRVERALDLAQHLLAGQPGWDADRLQSAVASGATRIVTLAEAVPIHLIYATVWVDAHGNVQFRDDIYEQDVQLKEALRQDMSHRWMEHGEAQQQFASSLSHC